MLKILASGSLFLMLLITACQPSPRATLDLETLPDTLQLFGEKVVSTPLYERDMAISPDGREIIFTLGDFRQNRRCLVRMHKERNRWTGPEILNISGRYQDIEPFFASDGNRLFFSSNRPLHPTSNRTDYNIWYSERQEGQWSEPVALPANINTEGNEFYPSVSQNGNLYFTATRADGLGREDIFLSEWREDKYQDPVPLDTAINTVFDEFNAYISPDETLLIFSSFGRPDDMGGGDLYASRRGPTGAWQPARPLAGINSEQLDYCPFVDQDRGMLYFTSERTRPVGRPIGSVEELIDQAWSPENGFGNIYRISLEALGIR